LAQFTLNPHPKWTIRSEAHWLNLASAKDLWYVGGGAFQKQSFGYSGRPSGGGRHFAFILDLSADYQFDSQTTLTFYAAHAAGKAVVRNLFPDGPTQIWFMSKQPGGFDHRLRMLFRTRRPPKAGARPLARGGDHASYL